MGCVTGKSSFDFDSAKGLIPLPGSRRTWVYTFTRTYAFMASAGRDLPSVRP